MTEKHKIPISVQQPCCGYCDSFHNPKEMLPNRERICAKGEKVWMMSNMCGAYHVQTEYQCPQENKKVSSVQCIVNRQIPFPHCMGCEVFLGEKGEARIKQKKVVKPKVLKPKVLKPKKAVSIHDIAKKRR